MSSWMSGLQSIWEIPEAKFIILGSALVGLIAVAIYVALKFRSLIYGGSTSYSDHLDDFQQMADRGELAPDEYKRVQASVKENIHRQLSKDAEEFG